MFDFCPCLQEKQPQGQHSRQLHLNFRNAAEMWVDIWNFFFVTTFTWRRKLAFNVSKTFMNDFCLVDGCLPYKDVAKDAMYVGSFNSQGGFAGSVWQELCCLRNSGYRLSQKTGNGNVTSVFDQFLRVSLSQYLRRGETTRTLSICISERLDAVKEMQLGSCHSQVSSARVPTRSGLRTKH